jgi:fucose permease
MTEDEATTLAGCVGTIAFIPANIAVGCVVNGWALVKLWGWFILPVFPSAPRLSTLSAIGLGLVIGFLTHQVLPAPTDEKTSAAVARAIIGSVIHPMLVLVIGYIVHKLAI